MPFQTSRAAAVEVLRGIEDGVKANYSGPFEIVAESIRPLPPEPDDFANKVVDWLAYKYGSQRFDVVVAVTATSVPSAIALRDRQWPTAPLLMFLQEEERERAPGAVPHSSRILIELSETKTLASALRMLPATRHVALVGGASQTDRRVNAGIAQHIRDDFPTLNILEIARLSWDETKTRVRTLPDESVILIGSFFYDSASRNIDAPTQVEELSAIANAPVLIDTDIAMGDGQLGGSVLSIRAAGIATGRQLAKLLGGPMPTAWQARK